MRKIKITALLLAVLMVMAVFAGCASSSDVDSLEQTVQDFINQSNANNSAQQEQVDKNTDDIQAILGALATLTDAVDSNKDAQDESNAALLAAIEALNKQLEDLNKQIEDIEKGNTTEATLEGIKNGYIKDLNEKKIACDLNKAEYVPADYQTVVTALTNGVSAVTAAKTEADAKKAYDEAIKVYNDNATVATKLIGFYTKASAGLTKDSAALIAEIKAYINGTAAVTGGAAEVKSTVATAFGITHTSGNTFDFAANAASLPNSIKAHAISASKNVNLIEELLKAVAAYEYLTGDAFKGLVDSAKNAIKAIGTVDLSSASLAKVTAARTAYDNFEAEVKGNGTYAAWIADSNLDLVDTLKTLTDAEARIDVLATAKVLYVKAIGTPNGVGGYTSAFDAYTAATVKVNYQLKTTVYDVINERLAKWIADYSLEPVNVAIIVNEIDGVNYEAYLADNHKVALFAKAHADFKAIADRITTLSNGTTLNTASFDEFKAITKAIDNWKKVQKADADNTNALLKPAISVNDYNFALIIEAYKLNNGVAYDYTAVTDSTDYVFVADTTIGATAADYTAAKNYVALYKFDGKDGAITEFYKVTFNEADAAATVINKAIKAIDLTKIRSIKSILAVDGTWVEASGKWTQKKIEDITVSGAVDTIAEFKKTYVTTTYDLSYLVKEADLTQKLTDAKKLIADQKVVATSLAATVKSINDTIKTNPINLDHKATVETAYASYQAAITKAGINVMEEFVLVSGSTTEYEYKHILDTAAAADLEAWNADIKTLAAEANALVALYTNLKKVNSYKAFAAGTLATAEAIMNKVTSSNKDYYDYLKADGTAVNNASAKKTEGKTGVGKQLELLELAESKYQTFMTNNSGKKYAAVETLRDEFKAANFEAVKALVVAAVNALTIENKDDYKDLIAGMTTEDEVHNIIADIYVRTGEETAAVTFGGVEVVKAASNYVVE